MKRTSKFGGDHATSRPEILFVIQQLNVGGTENHLAMIAPALVRKGWRVSVFSMRGNGPIGEILTTGGVEVTPQTKMEIAGPSGIGVRALQFLQQTWRLASTMRRKDPAIVHFLLPAAYLVGAPLAALAQIPIRVMSRRSQNLYQAQYPFVLSIERRLHRSMSALLGNSLQIVHELRDQEGVPNSKLGLIYNGIDINRFAQLESRPRARAELSLLPDSFVMVIVANLIRYKGHADLLNALADIQSRLPIDWRLLIVGRDDGIGSELTAQAASLGLSAHVDFLGPRSDVTRLLAASDVGLLCSHEEGFSNALLESMAAGLPVIATDVGGNGEAIDDGVSGLLVPLKDPKRLAQAILRLANDPELRARLGAAARRRVLQAFSLDHCVESYEALYSALLAGCQVGDIDKVRIGGR